MYHHLKSDLKVEHRGSYFKIINHQKSDNFVMKYIIQSLEDGQIKNVFRHELFPCPELEIAVFSVMFSYITSLPIKKMFVYIII